MRSRMGIDNMNTRLGYVKDFLFKENIFLGENNTFELHEDDESGKSVLTVIIENGDNLCIENFEKCPKSNIFREEKQLGLKKCCDHIIFQNCNGNYILHLIEMKSSVGYRTFENVKLKVRSSYLNAHMIACALGINIVSTVAYTTYSQLKFDSDANTNPRAFVVPLGERAYDVKKEEWDRDQIYINLGERVTIPHHPIEMMSNADGLVGRLTIPST